MLLAGSHPGVSLWSGFAPHLPPKERIPPPSSRGTTRTIATLTVCHRPRNTIAHQLLLTRLLSQNINSLRQVNFIADTSARPSYCRAPNVDYFLLFDDKSEQRQSTKRRGRGIFFFFLNKT